MEYRILQPLNFHAGALLGLTAEQAHVRRAVLKPLGDGLYEVVTEVNFKAGEVITFKGDLPKAMADFVQPASEPSPAKAAGARKKTEAKAAD